MHYTWIIYDTCKPIYDSSNYDKISNDDIISSTALCLTATNLSLTEIIMKHFQNVRRQIYVLTHARVKEKFKR